MTTPTRTRSTLTCAKILEQFPDVFSESIGDLEQTVTAVVAPELAKKNEMVFLMTPKALVAGLASQASVLVVSANAKEQALVLRGGRTVLISQNPERAMALVISKFFRPTPYKNISVQAVHPTAVIGENAKIAQGARVGPHAFIGANVSIAENAYVGANAVIEDNSVIGASTVIHPLVFIGHSTVIGARCEIHPNSVVGKEGFGYAHDERFNHTRIPHQGRVVLGDDVHIGACVTIDRATFGETRIENGVIIDNLVHIAHNNTIGRNSVLTSGFTIAGSSKIGANFVAGGRAIVAGHIEITDNVQVAALSAISKSVLKSGQYGGSPLQPLQAFLKTKAALAHLPQMQKAIKKISKHLGFEDEKQT